MQFNMSTTRSLITEQGKVISNSFQEDQNRLFTGNEVYSQPLWINSELHRLFGEDLFHTTGKGGVKYQFNHDENKIKDVPSHSLERYVLKIDKGKPENVPTTYRICNFCRSNGECSAFYSSHFLRDPVTKRLTCPILRKHVCPNCGASGDNGHTQSYCPKKKVQENCKHSLTLKLKKTERNSTSLRTKSK